MASGCIAHPFMSSGCTEHIHVCDYVAAKYACMDGITEKVANKVWPRISSGHNRMSSKKMAETFIENGQLIQKGHLGIVIVWEPGLRLPHSTTPRGVLIITLGNFPLPAAMAPVRMNCDCPSATRA